MKLIIFIGTTIFMSCFVVTNTFGQKIIASKNDAGSSFGRYGDCTTGRGICGIDADNINNKSTTAKFFVEKENDSTLILKIFNSSISLADEISLFGKACADFEKTEQIYFKMDVDLPLTTAAKTSLYLPANNLKIASGLYMAVRFDSYYMIELKLK